MPHLGLSVLVSFDKPRITFTKHYGLVYLKIKFTFYDLNIVLVCIIILKLLNQVQFTINEHFAHGALSQPDITSIVL